MFIQTQATPNPQSLMFLPGRQVMEVRGARVGVRTQGQALRPDAPHVLAKALRVAASTACVHHTTPALTLLDCACTCMCACVNANLPAERQL
jgi:hypothetical protein